MAQMSKPSWIHNIVFAGNNNYHNACLHQLAAGSWDTKSHSDVTYTKPIRAKLNHNLKMPKIKIIPNYYKNIEKAKKLNLPRELIYLRDSYIPCQGHNKMFICLYYLHYFLILRLYFTNKISMYNVFNILFTNIWYSFSWIYVNHIFLENNMK